MGFKTRCSSINLAVIITLVNTTTGDVLAAKRIAGPTRAKLNQQKLFDAVVRNIVKKCSDVVNAEFKRHSANNDQKSQNPPSDKPAAKNPSKQGK